MAANYHGHGDDRTRPPMSTPIPLQNLSRSPEDVASPEERGRPRGARNSARRSLLGRGAETTTYERVSGESPVATAYPTGAMTNPRISPYAHESANANDSPVDDLGGFAQAMSSVGLNFHGLQPTPAPAPSSALGRSSTRYTRSEFESDLDSIALDHYESPDPDHYFTSVDVNEDTAPLTDKRYVQPISGAHDSQPGDHGFRNDPQSSRFTIGSGQAGSRLGDDLPHLESGLGQTRRGSGSAGDRSRSRSPSSPGSALHRASSIMKSMSQRVVNLSNEPEVVEQSLRREESWKNSRMDEPPILPAMTDYAHDMAPTGSSYDRASTEKRRRDADWRYTRNPLRGRSLGILAPDNIVRVRLCDILVHPYTEPFILVVILVQTILLAIESAHSVWTSPRSTHWGSLKLDYVFFAIYSIYTMEIVAKILVSGLVKNAKEYSTVDASVGLRKAVAEKAKGVIAPHSKPAAAATSTRKPSFAGDPDVSILRTFTGLNTLNHVDYEHSDDPLQRRRYRLAHRAFLRHSFNRLDFVAVVSYWISFALSLNGFETIHQLYVFRMLSCLRILRLLALTNGTSVILRSLKKAAPLLGHVAFLIGFFWLLFAIVGIQSFKSSLRRTCVWVDPAGQNNFTMNDPYNVLQFCGGYLNQSNGAPMPWLQADGVSTQFAPKGYLCPQGSLCVEGTNPYNGTMSFDNIIQSLELVFVVMSSNTFTDLLYYTTYSDYLASALFFASGIVILSLWLVNLLVAVITHSFQVIREESKRSAFAANKIDDIGADDEPTRKLGSIKRFYNKTEWFWVCVILFGLVVQAMRSSTMGSDRAHFISVTETIVTLTLLLEIALRFIVDWRAFHKKPRNWVDLGLAVITCIIQIPAIKNQPRTYAVLTLFQILRVYRVVLAIPVTRNLIMIVFRNTIGLVNLIVFVFLITFLAAIFATQLFRGQIPNVNPDGGYIQMSFSDIYNSFLAMYQILSSENWTVIVYNAAAYTMPFNTAWISAAFLVLWFIVANFIVLNMFIAVIQESFDVSEDEKRLHQVKAFLEQKQVAQPAHGNLALSKIFGFGRESSRYRDPLDHGPAALEMLLKDAVVREFLDDQGPFTLNRRADTMPMDSTADEAAHMGLLSRTWARVKTTLFYREPNPFYSKLKFSRAHEELDAKTMAREVVSAAEQRKRAQREYLRKHPNYNKSLFIFAPDNPVRRFCQRIVGPGRGSQRAEGVDPIKPVWYFFSAFIYAAIVAMVVLACITTPIYQRSNLTSKHNWFVYTDLAFAILFSIEATIKVVADGFFWTPNAYLRSSWGFIDGVVLLTLWINVASSLFQDWGVSRGIGAFKALRALRLLNVSDSAKDTFHSVIVVGGWKVISAAAVSVSFLIPFAIYAVNLFSGQLTKCNDGNISGSLDACVNEYLGSPYMWNVLSPRVARNPYYDFDNFGDSLFILFQIVSQEGWIDVQEAVMAITGVGNQPQNNTAPANGLFFVIFNLLGAVFVLTLFVSIFIRNYTEQTGVAFLTAEQRSWLELRKLLRQISPSKRSLDETSSKFKKWSYRVAVKKHGRWARCVTVVLMLHLLLLVLEFYPEPALWDRIRETLFFVFTCVYVTNVIVRMIGLGWHRFRASSWDLYSLIVVPGTFVTTILNISSRNQVIIELNKLFLVSITLLLIPQNNQLDQLFKTAAASFTAIGNLLATWFVLFLVFAIAMNQAFGLTKFGATETSNLNFRDVPRALIFLFRTSCGEGWNQLMEDYATMDTPWCTYDNNFFNDDCGSPVWARSLFIAWNIISMYIFVSLFVSLIFESFSYVYQRSSGLYIISREEIRRFKQAWATFDPHGTGYITKQQFPRLLGELSGLFEMRIYDGEFTVSRIVEQVRIVRRDSLVPQTRNGGSDEVDLDKLSRILARIPVDTIRRRRERLNTFYEEVLVSADPVRGISFHSCLMILAHYNIISDSKSLRLEEFLRRRARLQRVEEAVRRNTVIGFFDTLYWSRRFRQRIDAKKMARMEAVPQFSVPEIFVDDGEQGDDAGEDQHQPQFQRQSQPVRIEPPDGGETSPRMLSPSSSPQSRRSDLPRIDTSFETGRGSSGRHAVDWSSISPSLSPRRRGGEENVSPFASDSESEMGPTGSMVSLPDGGTGGGGDLHSRQNSAVSVRDVIQSLDNSAWGESIRRSFTQHRPGGDGGHHQHHPS